MTKKWIKQASKMIIAASVIVSAGTASLTLTPSHVSAAALSYKKVIAPVNMRAGAGTNYKVVKLLSKGTVVEVIAQVNTYWIKVKASGVTGYMSTSSVYAVPYNETTPAPAWEDTAKNIINYGERYLGAPYVFGAGRQNDLTFDCSGFIYWVYNHNGVTMPKSGSLAMSSLGTAVSISDIQIGDLIFSDTNKDGIINHVGIYAGNGRTLHTYKAGIGVTYSLYEPGSFYYERTVVIKRVIKR